MNFRSFTRKNKMAVSLILFIFVFFIINHIKPEFLYDKKGSIRKFGLGYRQKTVLPLWLIVIVTAILSYLLVLFYITYPKIKY